MELFEQNSVSLYLADLVLLEELSSLNYEKIQLFEHNDLGKVLVLNGEIQMIEAWSPLYHETIVHLASAFIKKLKRVLILGGGCFFAAKEVLKYQTVEKLVMIDYDNEVVQMMGRNFLHVKEILSDKRFDLIINDAFQEIKNFGQEFDLIINDSIDLTKSQDVDHKNIFSHLSGITNSNGVCIDLIYRHIFEKKTTLRTIKKLKEQSFKTACSLITVPEYPGVLHLLSIWGRSPNISQHLKKPINSLQREWMKTPSTNPCEVYNPACLNYYLYMPPYLKRILNESNNI